MDNLFLGVWDSLVSWKVVCGIPCCCFIMYVLLKLQRAPQCSLIGEGIRKILVFSFFFFSLLLVINTGSFLELCIHWRLILSSTLYIHTRCVLAGAESLLFISNTQVRCYLFSFCLLLFFRTVSLYSGKN